MDFLFTEDAKITGKRQITIPKTICDILDLNTGDKVIFKVKDNTVIMEKDNSKILCFACDGEGQIDGKECFLCRGEKRLSKNISDEFGLLMWRINEGSLSYKVSTSYISEKLSPTGKYKYRDYPIFKIHSDNYPREILDKVQDHVQMLVIDYYSCKLNDEDLYSLPIDSSLDDVLQTLVTEDAKEEVKKWFKAPLR